MLTDKDLLLYCNDGAGREIHGVCRRRRDSRAVVRSMQV